MTINYNTNLEVFNKTSNYSNNYYGSKYNYLKFEDFKDINLVDHSNSHSVFFKYLNNKRTVDTEYLAIKLYKYYQNLSRNLYRVQSGSSDLMFRRFAYNSVMLKYENMFRVVTNFWEEAYNDAFLEYFQKTHHTFDESFGISYIAFFETHFAKILQFSFVNIDYNFNNYTHKYDNTYLQGNINRDLEVHRLSWCNENELTSDMSLLPLHLRDLSLIFEHPSYSLQPLTKL